MESNLEEHVDSENEAAQLRNEVMRLKELLQTANDKLTAQELELAKIRFKSGLEAADEIVEGGGEVERSLEDAQNIEIGTKSKPAFEEGNKDDFNAVASERDFLYDRSFILARSLLGWRTSAEYYRHEYTRTHEKLQKIQNDHGLDLTPYATGNISPGTLVEPNWVKWLSLASTTCDSEVEALNPLDFEKWFGQLLQCLEKIQQVQTQHFLFEGLDEHIDVEDVNEAISRELEDPVDLNRSLALNSDLGSLRGVLKHLHRLYQADQQFNHYSEVRNDEYKIEDEKEIDITTNASISDISPNSEGTNKDDYNSHFKSDEERPTSKPERSPTQETHGSSGDNLLGYEGELSPTLNFANDTPGIEEALRKECDQLKRDLATRTGERNGIQHRVQLLEVELLDIRSVNKATVIELKNQVETSQQEVLKYQSELRDLRETVSKHQDMERQFREELQRPPEPEFEIDFEPEFKKDIETTHGAGFGSMGKRQAPQRSLDEILSLKAQIEIRNRQLTEMRKEADELRAELNTTYKQLGSISEGQPNTTSSQTPSSPLRNQLDDANDQLAVLNMALKSALEELRFAQDKISKFKDKAKGLESAKEEIEDSEGNIDSKTIHYGNIEEHFKDTKFQLKELERADEDLANVSLELDKAQEDLKKYKKDGESVQGNTSKDRQDDNCDNLDPVSNGADETEKEREKAKNDELESVRAELKAKTAELAALVIELKETYTTNTTLELSLQHAKADYDLILSARKSTDGKISMWKSEVEGIRLILANDKETIKAKDEEVKQWKQKYEREEKMRDEAFDKYRLAQREIAVLKVDLENTTKKERFDTTCSSRLVAARGEIQALKEKMKELEREEERAREIVEEMDGKMVEEVDEYRARLERAREDIEAGLGVIKDGEARAIKLQKEIMGLKVEVQAKTERTLELEEKIATHKEVVNNYQEAGESAKRTIERNAKMIQELNGEITQSFERVNALSATRLHLRAEILRLGGRTVSLDGQVQGEDGWPNGIPAIAPVASMVSFPTPEVPKPNRKRAKQPKKIPTVAREPGTPKILRRSARLTRNPEPKYVAPESPTAPLKLSKGVQKSSGETSGRDGTSAGKSLKRKHRDIGEQAWKIKKEEEEEEEEEEIINEYSMEEKRQREK